MKLGAIVIDSDKPDELAEFYRKLLGWTIERQIFEGEKWIVVKSEKGEGPPLVFQKIDTYKRPKWPPTDGFQQQMLHLDFYVEAEGFDSAVQHAISCGATLSEIQLSESWKVMLDPAGHPFCLSTISQ